MADNGTTKPDSAEQAYEKAAAQAKPEPKTEEAKLEVAPVAEKAKAEPAPAPTAKKAKATPAPPKAKAKPPSKAKARKKTKAKPAPAVAKTAKAAPAKKTAAKTAKKKATKKPTTTSAKPQPTITELKEKIMATAKTTDFTKTMTDAMSEAQTQAKAAYEKSTEMAGEMTEFAKGNVEAVVESGKIVAAAVQDMGKGYMADMKKAYETASSDMKDMAAVKSPTELFQLQSKLLRRNFDSMVAFGSKSTESMVKLANDSVAPLSSRMSVAAEKFSKVA